MTDEEKAEEYIMREDVETMKDSECYGERVFFEKEVKKAYLDGLAEGKSKWHDLRKKPDDLPKFAENVQIVFYVKEYFESIEKYKNHYCLGFFRKSFLNDDIKVFVEKSKGYECEHSTEDVLFWCELPKFEE